MEKIASDLREPETKQRNLGKAFEALQSQTSSWLSFSLEWKELEDYLKSTRAHIRTQFEKLKIEEETKAKELKWVEELIKQGMNRLNYIELLIKQKDHDLTELENMVSDKKKKKKKKRLRRRRRDLI